MPWGRQDDDFYDHPKVRAMDLAWRNAACGLYWRAISFSNRRLTNGRLTEADIAHIDGRAEEVAQLVREKLFHRAGRGIRIHDFLDFNDSKAVVLEKRAKRAEAGRIGGRASGAARRSKPATIAEAHRSSSVEPPSRPVPSRPGSPSGEDARALGNDLMAMVDVVEKLTNRHWSFSQGNRVVEGLRYDVRDFGVVKVEAALRAAAATGEVFDPNVLAMDAHTALNPFRNGAGVRTAAELANDRAIEEDEARHEREVAATQRRIATRRAEVGKA